MPSGSGQAYWNKIAARVPGQSAAACKGMAETLLFEKAAGTQANYFGNYVEVSQGLCLTEVRGEGCEEMYLE